MILVSRRERNDITVVVRLEEREISLHVDRHMNSACRGCPVRARRTRRAIKIIHGGETWRDGRISCARLGPRGNKIIRIPATTRLLILSHRAYNACHRSHDRSLVYTRIHKRKLFFNKIIEKLAQRNANYTTILCDIFEVENWCIRI